jgi:hypothetical protein
MDKYPVEGRHIHADNHPKTLPKHNTVRGSLQFRAYIDQQQRHNYNFLSADSNLVCSFLSAERKLRSKVFTLPTV